MGKLSCVTGNKDTSRSPGSIVNSTPHTPGAALMINVVDEPGIPVSKGELHIWVEYLDFPDWNYTYSIDISLIQDGLLNLYPPPTTPAKVYLQETTPDRRKSEKLMLKSDEFWQAVEETAFKYVASHTFTLGKSEQIISVNYFK